MRIHELTPEQLAELVDKLCPPKETKPVEERVVSFESIEPLQLFEYRGDVWFKCCNNMMQHYDTQNRVLVEKDISVLPYATNWLHGVESEIIEEKIESTASVRVDSDRPVPKLVISNEYLRNRGLSAEKAIAMGMGSKPKKQSSGSIADAIAQFAGSL